MAIVTMSPTFFDGKLCAGTASVEENLSLDPSLVCCTFVGNMAATTFDVSQKSFELHWNITMIPEVEAAIGWSRIGLD